MRGFWKPVLKFVGAVALLAVIAGAVLRLFFVDVAVVGHNGMAPTMEAGDTILIWRGGDPDPDMGTVLMCLNPQNPADFVMGRVAGKPGMTLGTDTRGRLMIEGTVPDIDWGAEETFTDSITGTTDPMLRGFEELGNVQHGIYVRKGSMPRVPETRVAQDRVFLLGDNRTHVGQDSRYYGQVDPARCRGEIFMRLKPPAQSPNDLGTGWLDLIH